MREEGEAAENSTATVSEWPDRSAHDDSMILTLICHSSNTSFNIVCSSSLVLTINKWSLDNREECKRCVLQKMCLQKCILTMFKHKNSGKCIDICEWEFVVENGNCRRQGETDKTGWLEWGAATTECPVFIRTHQLTLVKLSCMTANMTASWPDNTRCKNIYQVFFIECLL